MHNHRLSTGDVCYIGIFASVISIISQINIPMPYGIPMTLQTLIIPLGGLILGPRRGTWAAFVYIAAGAVGCPVFTGLTGGLGVVFGKSGGFILSFPILALAGGLSCRASNKAYTCIFLISGFIVNSLCGMIMFSFVMSVGFTQAFISCVFPFIPTTIIKIVLLTSASTKLKKLFSRYISVHI